VALSGQFERAPAKDPGEHAARVPQVPIAPILGACRYHAMRINARGTLHAIVDSLAGHQD